MTVVSREDAATAGVRFRAAWTEAFRVYRESRHFGPEVSGDQGRPAGWPPQVMELMAAHEERLELLVAMTASPDWAVRDACATLGITDLAEASAYVSTGGRRGPFEARRPITGAPERSSTTAGETR